MPHSHHHEHDHSPADFNRAFALGVALNVAYILIEAGLGLWAGSLALLADAGHNLSDVLGLLLAWGASWLARFKPTDRYTYGLRSSTILAAMFNALLLLVAIGGITWEAFHRWQEPVLPSGQTIIWVAGLGVLINTATALLFLGGRKHDLNVRGAFLHMAADAAVSLGVAIAGAAILLTGAAWIDPLVSLIVALLIFLGTWGLFRESIDLALQAVPRHIDLSEIRAFLGDLDGVEEVHDLHVWAMSTTAVALTAHLVKPDPDGDEELLSLACRELRDRFGIEHTTIQLERNLTHACPQATPESW